MSKYDSWWCNNNPTSAAKRIAKLQTKLDAVKPHIADLRRCADVLQQNIGDPMKGTIAEVRKAADELDAAIGEQEQGDDDG